MQLMKGFQIPMGLSEFPNLVSGKLMTGAQSRVLIKENIQTCVASLDYSM
jgi:hypothetical protein